LNTAPIVSRVWNFCHTLKDDGVGYGDYLEQLTYLIFLKMADEYAKPPYQRDVGVPAGWDWHSLASRQGAELGEHYAMLLRELGGQKTRPAAPAGSFSPPTIFSSIRPSARRVPCASPTRKAGGKPKT